MEKTVEKVAIQSEPECHTGNEYEIALIRSLLKDAKELQQLKPSRITDRNIRAAEAMLTDPTNAGRAFYISKKLWEMGR